MVISISTDSALALKQAILKDADDGNLKTWRIVKSKESGQLLTHSPEQWNERVLLVLTPDEEDTILKITTTFWRGHPVPTDDDCGYYFGRFVEALLVNYRSLFRDIAIIV